MILAIDVETQGLPLFQRQSDHPDQPHLVQFAAAVVDPETRASVSAWNMIIKPDGWLIPPEATAIHGISTDQAANEGVKESIAVRTYIDAWQRCDTILGYSTGFDRRIMRIAMLRDGMTRAQIEAIEKKQAIDVMALCTPLCKLPPSAAMMATGRKTFKTPTLAQATLMLLGERLAGAHHAEIDLEATLRLYWMIQDLKKDNLAYERPTSYRADAG